MKNIMARLRLSGVLIVLAVIAYAGSASAGPITISNVNFTNGQGTLSGYFQTDATGNVTSWDLTSSQFNCNPCTLTTGFTGAHYTAGTSSAVMGFGGGNQQIVFFTNDTLWELAFVLACGGNNANCIGNAAVGDNIAISSSFEMSTVDFLPFRALDLAHLSVTDPPVGLTFNVVADSPTNGRVPEPGTLLLLVTGLGVLVGMRRKSFSQRI